MRLTCRWALGCYALIASCSQPPVSEKQAAHGDDWLQEAPAFASPSWPHADSRLVSEPVSKPAGFGQHRIVIDPGHGAPGNDGSVSAYCEPEGRSNLRVARDFAPGSPKRARLLSA